MAIYEFLNLIVVYQTNGINTNIHTYIHNWPLQPSSQDYRPSFSHHLCCMYNLICSIKSTLNDRFFEKLSKGFLFTLRVFARNLLRGNRRRNTFCILFWCLAWGLNPGFTSNKPTHYQLDYGDFKLPYRLNRNRRNFKSSTHCRVIHRSQLYLSAETWTFFDQWPNAQRSCRAFRLLRRH